MFYNRRNGVNSLQNTRVMSVTSTSSTIFFCLCISTHYSSSAIILFIIGLPCIPLQLRILKSLPL